MQSVANMQRKKLRIQRMELQKRKQSYRCFVHRILRVEKCRMEIVRDSVHRMETARDSAHRMKIELQNLQIRVRIHREWQQQNHSQTA